VEKDIWYFSGASVINSFIFLQMRDPEEQISAVSTKPTEKTHKK
jgi:hypothetical protein